tara:strand:+ start:509 stop:745 length:237 start_codon:yes stop_codon:yes gene_type:complete
LLDHRSKAQDNYFHLFAFREYRATLQLDHDLIHESQKYKHTRCSEKLLCKSFSLLKKWWALWDLNPRPTGYEPDALTN